MGLPNTDSEFCRVLWKYGPGWGWFPEGEFATGFPGKPCLMKVPGAQCQGRQTFLISTGTPSTGVHCAMSLSRPPHPILLPPPPQIPTLLSARGPLPSLQPHSVSAVTTVSYVTLYETVSSLGLCHLRKQLRGAPRWALNQQLLDK